MASNAVLLKTETKKNCMWKKKLQFMKFIKKTTIPLAKVTNKNFIKHVTLSHG